MWHVKDWNMSHYAGMPPAEPPAESTALLITAVLTSNVIRELYTLLSKYSPHTPSKLTVAVNNCATCSYSVFRGFVFEEFRNLEWSRLSRACEITAPLLSRWELRGTDAVDTTPFRPASGTYLVSTVTLVWPWCDPAVTLLWPCCDPAVTLLWPYCDLAVTLLWPCCDLAIDKTPFLPQGHILQWQPRCDRVFGQGSKDHAYSHCHSQVSSSMIYIDRIF